MKGIKQIGSVITLSLFAGQVVFGGVTPHIEQPVVLDDALLSITVSDVHGLLDGAGTVAAQVSPMMNGMMLKNMLGSSLGDPQLAGIAPGKGLAVVAVDVTNVFAIVEVEPAMVTGYTNAVAALGMAVKYEKGLLVIGQSAAQVDVGCARAPAVASKLFSKRSPTLRIGLSPSESLAKNSEQIQGMLQMMPMMMSMGMQSQGAAPDAMQGITKVVEAELRVLLSLASQIKTAEVTLAPENGSLRLSEVYDFVPGSRLATLCNAPVINKWNPNISAAACGNGAIQLDFCLLNPDAFSAFVAAEGEQVVKEMMLDDARVTAYLDYMKKTMQIYGGTVSENILGSTDGTLSIDYLMDVKDEAAALDMLKSMPADFESFGLLELYKGFGMEMSFEFLENAREYKGVKIHQLKMGIAMENMPAMQREQFETMGMDDLKYEVAIHNGIMAYSMGGAGMDRLIDCFNAPQTSPAQLAARTVFPAGGFCYSDIDIARYISFINSMIPDQQPSPIGPMAAILQGAEPVTLAGYRSEGRVMWSANVPGSLLAKIGQAAMMMQMQKMQQGGMAPQGVPQF